MNVSIQLVAAGTYIIYLEMTDLLSDEQLSFRYMDVKFMSW